MATIEVSSEDMRKITRAKAKKAEDLVLDIYSKMTGAAGHNQEAAAMLTLATIQAMDKV